MASQLGDLILETCNGPGQGSIVSLAGAPAGRRPFNSKFSNGNVVWYVMHDGAQWESGRGTFGAGTPNTITRPSTVSANSNGTNQRINFAGITNIYNEIIAEDVVSALDFSASYGARSYQRVKDTIIQFGADNGGASGNVQVSFPIVFPTAIRSLVLTGNIGALNALSVTSGVYSTGAFQAWLSNTSNGTAAANVSFFWIAIGH